MIVRRIITQNFAKHDSVSVALPETGLVLVTGKNGHGKSTIVEAVAQGVWGQSLRGAFGWRDGKSSGVEVHFEGGSVTRSVKGSKHTLRWQVGEHGAAEYATRSKAQEAFETHVGSFHVWRNACTFHTRDAARFSMATDTERKALLERLLEIDVLDRAYEEARERRRNAITSQSDLRSRVLASEERARVLATVLRDIEAQLEPEEDLEALRAQFVELKQAYEEAERTHNAAVEKRTAATAQFHELRLMLGTARSNLAKLEVLVKEGKCAMCGQTTHADHHSALDEERAAIVALTQQTSDAKLVESSAHEHELVTNLQLRKAREAMAAAKERGVAVASNIERNKKQREQRDEYATELERVNVEIAKRQANVDAFTREVALLTAAQDVLKPTGVRASILDSMVSALESYANDWLARLGLEHIVIALSSQTEKKSGGVSDKISMHVSGAGGGQGYAGASTGEQRRIDIALLLALGELASTARGMSSRSTLFVDELFDGLDAEGQEAAANMLRSIAATRCVVVITHNIDLITRLAPDVHLVAEEGTIR